jgi:predicted nicotinamide N-methyase
MLEYIRSFNSQLGDVHNRVLELGSGTGLGGIALAAQGAHVTLTDIDGHMQLIRDNVEANVAEEARRGHVIVEEYMWYAGLSRSLSM